VAVVEGGSAVASRFPFAKITGDARAYMPILKVLGFYDPHRRLVLAGRMFYGRVLGDHPLPFTERFFDGGATGHRGFAFQQLSPRVTADPMSTNQESSRVGGEEQFLGSGEVRLDVANIKSYPFGIVLFSDVGDVVAEPGDLDFTHLHWAAGIGLRWSPVVAIRLDFGYRLNRHDPDDPLDPVPGDRFAFHFSLGQAF
jgi:outer membrane protein assembly factor BamA